MLRDAINRIVELAIQTQEPKEIEIDGRKHVLVGGAEYSNKPEYPDPIRFGTLSGFARFIKNGYDIGRLDENTGLFVHVQSPTRVSFVAEADFNFGVRYEVAIATPEKPSAFPFGSFMSGEDFMIAIQSLFVQNVGDWDSVVANCAGIKKQDGIEYKDNGITQAVAVQSGLSLAGMKKVPNPVLLAPYRTFAEIEQPISSFTLRVTDGRIAPELALFEADGGAWRLRAIDGIKKWLEAELPDEIVLA